MKNFTIGLLGIIALFLIFYWVGEASVFAAQKFNTAQQFYILINQEVARMGLGQGVTIIIQTLTIGLCSIGALIMAAYVVLLIWWTGLYIECFGEFIAKIAQGIKAKCLN